MAKAGYVYILTNPSFRKDWVKIGKSARPVNTRCKELDNTAVPLPFEVYATLKTEEFGNAEKLIHKMIDRFTKKRIRKNREFFNIEPDAALDILRDVRDVLGGEIAIEGPKPQPRPKTVIAPATLVCRASNGADAKCIKEGEGCRVLKGGVISKTLAPSFKSTGYYKLRLSLEADGTIRSRIFQRDCVFKSLSAASSVILGRASNGKVEWKKGN